VHLVWRGNALSRDGGPSGGGSSGFGYYAIDPALMDGVDDTSGDADPPLLVERVI
jgi:hypothetical protein